MGYTLRDHTADVAVEATGQSLGDTFAAVAAGLTAAMCASVPEGGERFEIRRQAEQKEALLFDYLDQLIYERDVREVLPVAHDCTVSQEQDHWLADASARGVPLQDVVARDVKAVTYSQMRIEQTESGWMAYVVFDV
ncbi:MAG: hypothetical protein A07HR60_00129 [uncultured archaeon A07HR60]|nr:MAG: hypothetical protein A07HR60_00129 [uncultured archaeon A07HR60]